MKTLVIDIETSPNLAYVWGLWKQNIPLVRLQEAGQVLCWSAKWVGSDDVMFDSIYHNGKEEMLHNVWLLLNECDAVIHYNGTLFDIPTLNSEFVLAGFPPPAPFKQIDLYHTVKRRFRFPSSKLEYVADKLGCGEKEKKDVDFQLWRDCIQGNVKAWRTMEKYNKKDVLLTEAVYHKLLPWITNHPNVALYADDEDNLSSNPLCPKCGEDALVKSGTRKTAVSVYQRYVCKKCGSWSRGRHNLVDREKIVHGNVCD